jgi:broad specificity phosphatase PhoE
MLTTLYLIRHGETEGSETRRYKGHMDVPLSEHGAEQMKRLAKFISTEVQKCKSAKATSALPDFCTSALTSVYCSDLSRAVKSAELIAEPHGLKPVIIPELRERNFGVWEGMSFDEIKENYPEEFNAWADNPLKFSPMEGESTIKVRDRAVGALEIILNRNADNPPIPPLDKGGRGGVTSSESIAIVSHGGINRILLCELLGIPLENIFRIEQDYGCLNVVELWDNYPVVKLINGRLE